MPYYFTDSAQRNSLGVVSNLKFFLNPLTLSDSYGNVAPTAIRNSTATVLDHEGILSTVGINEQRVEGARRVENLISFPEDFSNAFWSIYTSGGGTFTLSPDKKSITFDAPIGGRAFVNPYYYTLPATSILSFNRVIHNGITTISSAFLGSALLVSNAEGRISLLSTGGGTAVRFGVGCNGVETSAVNITYTLPQLEEVTAQANQNPSEFVNGTAWFNNLNGNTVDPVTHVVTEATGALLHPHKTIEGASTPWVYPAYATATVIPTGSFRFDAGKYYSTALGGTTAGATLLTDTGVTDWVEEGLYNSRFGLMCEDSGTNDCPAPEDFTAWTNTGTVVGASTVPAPDGSLTADMVTEDSSVSHSLYTTPAAIASGSTFSTSVHIKKGGRRYWQIGGGTLVGGFGCIVDLDTGTITSTGASAGAAIATYSIESLANGWYRVAVTGTYAGLIPYVILQSTDSPTWAVGTTIVAPSTLTTHFWGGQKEDGILSSYHTATRATELGNLKWSTANLPTSGQLTWWLGWQPDFTATDIPPVGRVLLGFANNQWGDILTQVWDPTKIGVKSQPTTLQTVIPYWNTYDDIELVVTADDAIGKMQLHYRNVTQNTAWVHSPLSNYDGAFTDTGFAQLFKAGGKNNSHVHALMGWSETKTNAWIEATLP
ncbi:MAG: hypothetical protein R8M45_03635 [Ghiorsea sp.]